MSQSLLSVALACGDCKFFRAVQDLYCCAKCAKLECCACVSEEIASYFCPQCLSVVASRQAYELDNRCRKCAQCAQCAAPLQTGSSTSVNGEKRFFLVCPYCRWSGNNADSPAHPLLGSFESLEALQSALQTHGTACAPWADQVTDAIEAERARRQKATASTAAQHRSTYVRGARVTPRRTPSKANAPRAPFTMEARRQIDQDKAAASKVVQLEPTEKSKVEPKEVASVEQQIRDVAASNNKLELVPRRMLLETKTTKRCSSCSSLLVKPDLAADKASFSELNSTAAYVLPYFHARRVENGDIDLIFENESASSMSVAVENEPAIDLAPFDDAEKCVATVRLSESGAASVERSVSFTVAGVQYSCLLRVTDTPKQ